MGYLMNSNWRCGSSNNWKYRSKDVKDVNRLLNRTNSMRIENDILKQVALIMERNHHRLLMMTMSRLKKEVNELEGLLKE
ncbi:hypothetical protein ACVXZY_15830 [Staphylococcus aureus]